GAVSRVDGDMPGLIDATTSQLSDLARAPLARLPATLQFRAIALNNKGAGLLVPGRPRGSQRCLWIGSAAAPTAGLDLVEINALGHLALLEAMFGSVREAELLVRNAREQAERHGWLDSLQGVAADFAGG